MENEHFIVYHADELTAARNEGVDILNSMHNVQVRNLKTWYTKTYPHDQSKRFNDYRGYYCKPSALLAAPFHTVAIIDLDAILTDSPFRLINSSTFKETGAYLFTDRRGPDTWVVPISQEEYHALLNPYVEKLKNMWAYFHPERPTNYSDALLQSSPFTGYSHHYGESAVVLYNKSHLPSATKILTEMLHPDMLDNTMKHIHGDKEVYWQSLALADLPGM